MSCDAFTTTCPQFDYVLDSQVKVDALGNTNCDEIVGNLLISDYQSSISSLSPLTNIKIINGGLTIEGISVTDSAGLRNLEQIGDSFYLRNTHLTNLDRFAKLKASAAGWRFKETHLYKMFLD